MAAASLLLLLSRTFVARVSWRAALGLALLPLLFTGRAMVSGSIYGPSDLYYLHDPWRALAAEQGISGVQNGILSDLAFANIPWRAAVREALANGRLPLWNRFVLGGNPLLGSASAAVFHPSTVLGIFLPVALSWTFSCSLTIFLALLTAFLFFREIEVGEPAALLGAVVWGFSTYMIFWLGWSVGTSTASFPLLLLGLRRLARGSASGLELTAAALLLTIAGGHPESVLHETAAGGAYFLFELQKGERGARLRRCGAAFGAGILAALLTAPLLLPLLEAIPHSAEYRARRAALAAGSAGSSVGAGEALGRLLPAILPFSHGIYGKTLVQEWRKDGSGMPFAYCGSLVFPLAIILFLTRGRRRAEMPLFLGFVVVGLLMGSSAPGLSDLLARLPGFRLALNYRLVFLAAIGFAGLAALGADELERSGLGLRLSAASLATALALGLAFLLSRGVFSHRELPADFVHGSFWAECAPLLLLGAAACVPGLSPRTVVCLALLLLAAQRVAEMGNTYPTLPSRTLAPPLSALSALPPSASPYRIAATGETMRPNSAALYGLEDVRGYESIVLDRFADTFPLWCRGQFASFNRVDDLERSFLSFLGVRYAIAPPDAKPPSGWRLAAASREMSIFENPAVLERAFVPRSLRYESRSAETLAQMAAERDFSRVAWIRSEAAQPETPNGSASLAVRESGPDLVLSADAGARVLVATSLPDWPGWSAQTVAGNALPLQTINHAFVGVWLPAGHSEVRLRYRPRSFAAGLAAFAAGLVILLVLRSRSRPRVFLRAGSDSVNYRE
jgi:Bacterial membrane protein YfhO